MHTLKKIFNAIGLCLCWIVKALFAATHFLFMVPIPKGGRAGQRGPVTKFLLHAIEVACLVIKELAILFVDIVTLSRPRQMYKNIKRDLQ